MQYRYFIGISLPPDLSKQFASLQTLLFDDDALIAPLIPHITVLPPPLVQDIPPEILANEIRPVARNFLPIPVRLDTLTTFGNRSLVVKATSPRLAALYQHLTVLLRKHGVPLPSRAFQPHVTLCQAIRGGRLPREITARYHQAVLPLLPVSFRIERLTLYTWQAPRTYTEQPL